MQGLRCAWGLFLLHLGREEKKTVPRSEPPVLGGIRGDLLGERKDKKRSAEPFRGLYLFKGKGRGSQSGVLYFRGRRKKFTPPVPHPHPSKAGGK